MDRLFRKRTASTSHVEKQPSLSGHRTPSSASSIASPQDARQTVAEKKSGSKAPSLNVDIRNSLILPSLSQRFSVLIPSLSTAPEESLRSLIASQRARHDGPALTEEEEELLFAELRGTSADGWDGQPPAFEENWARREIPGETRLSGKQRSFGKLTSSSSSPSLLTTSTSSPSVLSTSEDGGPTTSMSFSSFQTFGANSNSESQAAHVKTKSYGFSGGSGMREAEYIRRVKKSTSRKDLKGSGSSLKSLASDSVNEEERVVDIPALPRISPEKANAYYAKTRSRPALGPESPSGSEKTATPPSALSGSSKPRSRHRHSPSASASLNSSVRTSESARSSTLASADSHGQDGKPQKSRQRQSMLVGMSAAQVKRISLALQEIGGELQRKGPVRKQSVGEPMNGGEEQEEMLENEPTADPQRTPQRPRKSSDLQSDRSSHSAVSSVFPFTTSPTNSTYTGTTGAEATSPSRLPPSPRSHNLLAHVEARPPPIPMPVFTPTRSQPVKHRPTLSSSTFSPQSPPQPVYIPGQPRPVGSLHRSTASTSSRSATPSNHSPADTLRSAAVSPEPQSDLESSPISFKIMPLVTARSSSLARSRSVTLSTQIRSEDPSDASYMSTSFSRRRAGTLTLGETERQSSSPLTTKPLTSVGNDDEGENEDGTSEDDNYQPSSSDHHMPEVKRVLDRRSVADSRRDSAGSIKRLAPNDPYERTVSLQGTIEGSGSTPATTVSTAPNSPPMSPTATLRRPVSDGSLNSSFNELVDDGVTRWTTVLDGSRSDKTDSDSPSESVDTKGNEIDILRKLSGVGLEELALLQGKLVQKAKLEREALRGDFGESPVIPFTPTFSNVPFDPAQHNATPEPVHLAAPLSPPMTASPPSTSILDHYHSTESEEAAGDSDAPAAAQNIITPPLTSTATHSRSGSKSSHIILPSRPPPPPPVEQAPIDTPSEGHDEIVSTPTSAQVENKSSAQQHGRLPLEQDPEVRRDFEARIAAATAALNRTPSSQVPRLERKFTKRGGPMVISSPTLMSSTANVPATPLTPPEPPVSSKNAKPLEKTSGSGSKMSSRWKKLAGLKKRPSLSGNEIAPFPIPPPRSHPPVQPQPQVSLQRSQSQVQKQLDAPIALRTNGETSAPPNLNTFRFPPQSQETKPEAPPSTRQVNEPSPPDTAGSKSGLKGMMTKLKRGKEDKVVDNNSSSPEPSPIPPISAERKPSALRGPPPPLDLSTTNKASLHASTLSSDSAIEKFIDAGRQLGLNQEQLNEMLAQKGVSPTTSSAAPTSHTRITELQASPEVLSAKTSLSEQTATLAKKPSTNKGKRGLFRSLSKRAQSPSSGVSPPVPAVAERSGDAVSAADRTVVRRTMILPEGLVIVPSTPQTNSTPRPQDSPNTSSGRPDGTQRKQSVRRKPINLSEEDHKLVSSSPPAHKSRFSHSGASSQKSDTALVGPTGDLQGLGFLQPNLPLGLNRDANGSFSGASSDNRSMDDPHARSSTGGSLIDMYADDEQEMLQASPDKDGRGLAGTNVGSTQAVEICEYADGKVVWNIVDALRTSIAGSVDGEEYTFDPAHSRETSFSTSRPGSLAQGDNGDVFSSGAGWPSRMGGGGIGVQALNFRHRDRNAAPKPRPPTDIYFTSSADVADLIDHLSRDLDASHGRIDILPHLGDQVTTPHRPSLAPSPAMVSADSGSSPFQYQASSPFEENSQSHDPPQSPSLSAQFEDAPSPQRPGPAVMVSPHTSTTRNVPAGGYSPSRQLFVRQSMTVGHKSGMSGGSIHSLRVGGGGGGLSPSAASFADSQTSGMQGNTVEDRLQALLDKLKAGGAQGSPRMDV